VRHLFRRLSSAVCHVPDGMRHRHTHTHMRARTHTHNTNTHTRSHARAHTHARTHSRTHAHAHTRTHTHTHIHTRTHTHAHTRTHTHTHTHIHTHTHTHTYTHRPARKCGTVALCAMYLTACGTAYGLPFAYTDCVLPSAYLLIVGYLLTLKRCVAVTAAVTAGAVTAASV